MKKVGSFRNPLFLFLFERTPKTRCEQGRRITTGSDTEQHGERKADDRVETFDQSEDQDQNKRCRGHQRSVDGTGHGLSNALVDQNVDGQLVTGKTLILTDTVKNN